ncbi:MAG: PAS domain S-box protein [Candidatus Heimdallarchaeota archaeon]|nr:PAS domain S-box protein [Candidatus Heimdallarchaeota archaeon]
MIYKANLVNNFNQMHSGKENRTIVDYQIILASSQNFVQILDKDGIILYVNKIIPSLKLEDVIGQSVFNFLDPKYTNEYRNAISHVLEHGENVSVETYNVFHQYYLNQFSPIYDGGKVMYVLLTAIDITKNKQYMDQLVNTKKSLEKRNKELKCLYDISSTLSLTNISIWEKLQQITVIIVSSMQFPEYCSCMINLSHREVVSENFEKSTNSISKDIIVNNKRQGTISAYYKEGSVIQFLDEEKQLLISISTKLANFLYLQEMEYKTSLLIEKNMDGFFVINENLEFIDVNKTYCDLMGYSQDELLKLNLYNLEAIDDKDEINTKLQTLKDSGHLAFESKHKTKSGQLIDLEITVSYSYDMDIIFCMVHDITEILRQKKIQKKIEEKMFHSKKLESLGLLAGGIAHDFNNYLMSIKGNVSMALMEVPPSHSTYEMLNEIKEITNKATDLTSQMVAYAGKGEYSVKVININDFIIDLRKIIDISTKRSVVKYDLVNEKVNVKLDSRQFQQLIINLVTNAAESITHDEGEIIISTRKLYLSDSMIAEMEYHGKLYPGEYVVLSIGDNGKGIPEDIRNHIFEPFFSTKKSSRGLGLSIVHTTILNHNYAINYDSVIDKGTKMNIYIPVTYEEIEEFEINITGDESNHGDKTILIVDDEVGVRKIIHRIVEKMGYVGIEAENGKQGLEVLENTPVDCIILDLKMPVMDGIQMWNELVKMNFDKPVLFSSGYTEYEISAIDDYDKLAGFIQKPYDFHQLESALLKIL